MASQTTYGFENAARGRSKVLPGRGLVQRQGPEGAPQPSSARSHLLGDFNELTLLAGSAICCRGEHL
jgi:hypothetical protein